MEWQVVDWMHLYEDQRQWWAFLNTVMNLRIPEEAVHFSTNSTYEERLAWVELISAVIIHVDPVEDMRHIPSDFPVPALDSLIFDINSQGESKLVYVVLYQLFVYLERSLDLRFL
jgi:hypothetical protein